MGSDKRKVGEEAGSFRTLTISPKNGFHFDGSGKPVKVFEGGVYISYFRRLIRKVCISYISSLKILSHSKTI